MLSQWLVLASALVIALLGSAHMVFTFVGNKLHPRDAELITRMQSVAPVISRQTTMWRAWIGFNASHSLGAILFGLVYGYLAMVQPTLLFGSWFLGLTGLATLLCFLVLAVRYWFNRPLQGISLALVLYIAGFVLA